MSNRSTTAFIIFCISLFALVTIVVIMMYREEEDCHDAGGVIERYNCHHTFNGKTFIYTCDRRCKFKPGQKPKAESTGAVEVEEY